MMSCNNIYLDNKTKHNTKETRNTKNIPKRTNARWETNQNHGTTPKYKGNKNEWTEIKKGVLNIVMTSHEGEELGCCYLYI